MERPIDRVFRELATLRARQQQLAQAQAPTGTPGPFQTQAPAIDPAVLFNQPPPRIPIPIPRPAQGSAPPLPTTGIPLPTTGPLYPNLGLPPGVGPQIYPQDIQALLAQLAPPPVNPSVFVPPAGQPAPLPGPAPVPNLPVRDQGGIFGFLDPALSLAAQVPGAVAAIPGAVADVAQQIPIPEVVSDVARSIGDVAGIGGDAALTAGIAVVDPVARYAAEVMRGEADPNEDLARSIGDVAPEIAGEITKITMGESDVPANVAAWALRMAEYADRPRQWRVGVAGEAAYDIASGGLDLTTTGGLLDFLAIFDLGIEFGGGEAFTEWVTDPENHADIRRVHDEGYDANGDGVIDFTGGDAVWEFYIGQQPALMRGLLDLWFDPLNLPALVAAPARALMTLGARTPGVVGIVMRLIGGAIVATDELTNIPFDAIRRVGRPIGFMGPFRPGQATLATRRQEELIRGGEQTMELEQRLGPQPPGGAARPPYDPIVESPGGALSQEPYPGSGYVVYAPPGSTQSSTTWRVRTPSGGNLPGPAGEVEFVGTWDQAMAAAERQAQADLLTPTVAAPPVTPPIEPEPPARVVVSGEPVTPVVAAPPVTLPGVTPGRVFPGTDGKWYAQRPGQTPVAPRIEPQPPEAVVVGAAPPPPRPPTQGGPPIPGRITATEAGDYLLEFPGRRDRTFTTFEGAALAQERAANIRAAAAPPVTPATVAEGLPTARPTAAEGAAIGRITPKRVYRVDGRDFDTAAEAEAFVRGEAPPTAAPEPPVRVAEEPTAAPSRPEPNPRRVTDARGNSWWEGDYNGEPIKSSPKSQNPYRFKTPDQVEEGYRLATLGQPVRFSKTSLRSADQVLASYGGSADNALAAARKIDWLDNEASDIRFAVGGRITDDQWDRFVIDTYDQTYARMGDDAVPQEAIDGWWDARVKPAQGRQAAFAARTRNDLKPRTGASETTPPPGFIPDPVTREIVSYETRDNIVVGIYNDGSPVVIGQRPSAQAATREATRRNRLIKRAAAAEGDPVLRTSVTRPRGEYATGGVSHYVGLAGNPEQYRVWAPQTRTPTQAGAGVRGPFRDPRKRDAVWRVERGLGYQGGIRRQWEIIARDMTFTDAEAMAVDLVRQGIAPPSTTIYSTIPGLPQTAQFATRVAKNVASTLRARRANPARWTEFEGDLPFADHPLVADLIPEEVNALFDSPFARIDVPNPPGPRGGKATGSTPVEMTHREAWAYYTTKAETDIPTIQRLLTDYRSPFALSDQQIKELDTLMDEWWPHGDPEVTPARRLALNRVAGEAAAKINPDFRQNLWLRTGGAWQDLKLYNPYGVIQYVKNNMAGNFMRAVLRSHWSVAFRQFDAKSIVQLGKVAAAKGRGVDLGDPSLLRSLSLGRVIDDFGYGILTPEDTRFLARGVHATAYGRRGRRAWQETYGKGQRWGLPRRYMRGAKLTANSIDNISRVSLKAREWTHQAAKPRRALLNDLLNPDSDVRRRLGTNLPEDEIQALFNALGQRFDPAKLFRGLSGLAVKHGAPKARATGWATRVSRDWATSVEAARKVAKTEVDRTFFSYEGRRVDDWLRYVSAFHFYATRALPGYAEDVARHPGLLNAVIKQAQWMGQEAEERGYPDTWKAFVRIFESPGGWALFWSPLSALGSLGWMYGAMGNAPDGESWLGKILRQGREMVGLGLYPWLEALLDAGGYLGDTYANDPFGFERERAFYGFVVHYLGAKRDKYIGRPYEEFLNVIYATTSRLAAEVLPGARPKTLERADANILNQIRQLVYDDFEEDLGRPLDPSQYPDDMESIMMLEEDIAREGPRFQDANLAWSEAQRNLYGIRGMIPGTIRQDLESLRETRAERREARAALATDAPPTDEEQQWLAERERITGRPSSDFDVTAHREWQATEAEIAETPGNLERSRLLTQDFEFDHLLPEQEQSVMTVYYAIVFGDPQPVTVGGVSYGGQEIAEMSEADRERVANAWLDEHGGLELLGRYTQLRDAYLQGHPEYNAYRAWSRTERDRAQTLGGETLWRQQMAREHPEFAAYLAREQRGIEYGAAQRGEPLAPSDLDDRLNARAFSVDAYLAMHGKPTSSAQPLAATDPTQLSTTGVAAQPGAESPAASLPMRVAEAVTRYEADLAQANAILAQIAGPGTRFDELPDIVQQYFMAMYPHLFQGYDVGLAQDYQAWAAQAAYYGQDASQASFVAATLSGRLTRETRQTADVPGVGNLVTSSGGPGYTPGSFGVPTATGLPAPQVPTAATGGYGIGQSLTASGQSAPQLPTAAGFFGQPQIATAAPTRR